MVKTKPDGILKVKRKLEKKKKKPTSTLERKLANSKNEFYSEMAKTAKRQETVSEKNMNLLVGMVFHCIRETEASRDQLLTVVNTRLVPLQNVLLKIRAGMNPEVQNIVNGAQQTIAGACTEQLKLVPYSSVLVSSTDNDSSEENKTVGKAKKKVAAKKRNT